MTTPAPSTAVTEYFDQMWSELHPIGRAESGGYNRFAWTQEDMVLRDWFMATAKDLGLDVTYDRVGNLWAWWGNPDVDGPGVIVGSHLDSVPEGGAFDGPLGVVSSLAAVKELQLAGFKPTVPLGVACFSDEEGARFGVACGGSRLLTGAMTPERGLALTDGDGVTMADAMKKAGFDPTHVGRDEETLSRIGCFVELHIEQGKLLANTEWEAAAVSAIWPHGRFRVDFEGRADHAGTTRLPDRQDPMLDLAQLIVDTRSAAEKHECVATIGKLHVNPNGVNAIPAHVTAWLDARGSDADIVKTMVAELSVGRQVREESWTGSTDFDPALTAFVAETIGGDRGPAPIIETGAGHDAGILSNDGVPTTMLHVQNPTGTSHSPHEFAERVDCLSGIAHLTAVVEKLCSKPKAWLDSTTKTAESH